MPSVYTAVSLRRQSSVRTPRAIAREIGPKSVELEQRIARLEIAQRDLLATVQELTHRIAAFQAELQHLAAKVRY